MNRSGQYLTGTDRSLFPSLIAHSVDALGGLVPIRSFGSYIVGQPVPE